MKSTIIKLLLFLCITFETLHAQVPQAIPYQAVARDLTGNPYISQSIILRFSIHDVSAGGATVYSETQPATTNTLGLFTVNIGQGTPVTGTFPAINWGTNAKFLQVELDITGAGVTYTDMGTQQLLSVPYALYSGKSANLPDGTANGNTLRWNGTTWIADNAVTNTGSNVGIGTAAPSSSATLDLTSTTKGFLMPRMTTVQRNAIASPALGLQIFNLDDQCVDIYDGTDWIKNCGIRVTSTTIDPNHPTPNSWILKANCGGGERLEPVGFSIGNKGYIGTGYFNFGGYKTDFWEYDPTTGIWTQIANFGGSARMSAVGFSIGSKGYVGTGNDGTYKSDFWEYNPTSDSWTQKAPLPALAGPREKAVGFSINNKGYIGTGYRGIYLTDFWEYDPTNDSWISRLSLPTGARADAVGFSIGSKGYIGTGSNISPADFWEFNPTLNTWTQKANFTASGTRSRAVGFSIGNKGYIGTGYSFVTMNDFWEYNPVNDGWTQKANFGGIPRLKAIGFSIGNKGYIGGGYNGAGTYYIDFWEYMDDNVTGINYSSTVLTGQNSTFSDGAWTISNNDIYNSNNGNVGIGTTTPETKLSIKSFLDNMLTLSSSNPTNVGSGPILVLKAIDDLSVESTGFIGQIAKDIHYPYRTGALELRPQSRINFYKSNATVGVSPMAMTILNSGNVGIGTISPTATLDITGNLKLTDGTQGLGYILQSDATGLASWANLNSLETDPKVGTLSVNKIPKWNGSSLTDGIMHDNGSKIGIGTADPLHAFHVHNGNFMVTGGTSIGGPMILFGGGTTLTGPGADYNGMWGIEYEPTDGGLNFWKPNPNPSGSGNYFLFLSNNGNIGIGTNIPSQKLEVNGNIKFTDNGEISSYSNNHRILFRRFENKMEFREYGDIIFSPGATAGLETSRMVFNANGNAGFGINSPQTKIHIDGGTDADFTNTSGYLTIGNNGTTNLVFDDNEIMSRNNGAPSRLFLQNSGGNVGINSNAAEPLAALDVNGTVKFGSAGTVLAAVIKETVSTASLLIPANTTSVQTYTISNTVTTASVLVSPATAINAGLIIAYARVSALGTVEVAYRNTTGAGITLNSGINLFITAIQ